MIRAYHFDLSLVLSVIPVNKIKNALQEYLGIGRIIESRLCAGNETHVLYKLVVSHLKIYVNYPLFSKKVKQDAPINDPLHQYRSWLRMLFGTAPRSWLPAYRPPTVTVQKDQTWMQIWTVSTS